MKKVIKIIIYILIITLFLQRIYNRQRDTDTNKIRIPIFLSTTPHDCQFESNAYYFRIPDCRSYKLGSVIQITGLVNEDSGKGGMGTDSAFFEKKRLIIESIDPDCTLLFSPELWLKYIFFIFQTKKEVMLNGFLPTLNSKNSYLIGRLSFGSGRVKSENVDHLFKVTGTQYLASISGFHLNLIIRFFVNFVRKFVGKKLVGVIALVVSSVYLLFVGSQIPLVRAFFMLVFSVVSTSFLLRQNNSMYSLFLVAMYLIYIDISIISSISFQLSFAATASIILFTRNLDSSKLANLHLSNFIDNQVKIKKTNISGIISHISKYIIDTIKISIYVQIILIPLVLYHFNELSIISLVVSIALTWLVPGLIILGFILLLFSLLDVNKVIIELFVLPLNFLSEIFLSILQIFDNEIFIIKVADFPWWYVLLWWLVVIIFLKLFFRKKQAFSLVYFV